MSGMVYAVAQHMYRSGANDPQLQTAVDLAGLLNAGVAPASVVPGRKLDIASSLGVAVGVYDSNHTLISTDAVLDGAPATPPVGVLDSARGGIDTVTWQPRDGVRMALVAVPWKGGVVTAARSLGEVERRIGELGSSVLLGWLFSLAVGIIACWVAARMWLGPPQPIAAELPAQGRPPVGESPSNSE